MIGLEVLRNSYRFRDKTVLRLPVLCTDPAIVEKRHGNDEISETPAFHMDQRKNPVDDPVVSFGKKDKIFMSETSFYDRPPSIIVIQVGEAAGFHKTVDSRHILYVCRFDG